MKNADDILDETLGILDPVEKELGIHESILRLSKLGLEYILNIYDMIFYHSTKSNMHE